MKEIFEEMKKYVGFTDEDQAILKEIFPVMKRYIPELVDIFYSEVQQHDGTLKVITGGEEQIQRLKGTLTQWLIDFFDRNYDGEFAHDRFKIGYKHVDIELDQKFVISAMGLVEKYLIEKATYEFSDSAEKLQKIVPAISRATNVNLNLMCETYTTALHDKLAQKEKEDLDNFLKITGISEKLFAKMVSKLKSK